MNGNVWQFSFTCHNWPKMGYIWKSEKAPTEWNVNKICFSVNLCPFQNLSSLSVFRWFKLNHLIASRVTNYHWPFGTLPFGLFGSNLDTRDLETYPRTYSGHFWNMSLFGDSRAIWILFRKLVVSENQSFLDEGAIITPLSV